MSRFPRPCRRSLAASHDQVLLRAEWACARTGDLLEQTWKALVASAILRAERDGNWSAWACEQMEAWARAQDRLSRVSRRTLDRPRQAITPPWRGA